MTYRSLLDEPLSPPQVFIGHVARNAVVPVIAVIVWLAIGTVGYELLVPDLPWIDAFREASMLMSGMGPVFGDAVKLSAAAKLFDSIYALICGVLLLGATGVMFAPLWHRFIHRLHLEDAADRG
jgi:ABC-type dipeptide/oligopeptide/nickel transport system permease component